MPIAAVAVCILSLVFAVPALAADAVRLKVGYIPVGDCLQYFVAEEEGYFAAEGLAVDSTSMKGGAVIAPAVEGGELAIGWSNAVSIILAHAKGFDFVFLAPGATGVPRAHALLVPADSPITSVAGLGGKTVAINTLGNINEAAMRALAQQAGIAPDAIRLVEIPFPDMAGALAKGTVQAALANEPFVTDAVSRGTAKILDPAPHAVFGSPYLIGAWFAKKDWITAHPEQAAAFARAVAKAAAFIDANPERARQLLSRRTGLAPELAASITLPHYPRTLDPQVLAGLIDVSARFGLLAKPFPPAAIVDAPATQ